MTHLIAIQKFIFSILYFGFISCGSLFLPTNTAPSIEKKIATESIEDSILNYVNQHRKSMKLNSLSMLSEVSKKAAQHSENMAKRRTPFGHDGFELRAKYIADKTGAWSAIAENVAYGNLTAKQVVAGWLNSPGHKKNIEGNYTFTGIGVAKDKKGIIFFTQIFVREQ